MAEGNPSSPGPAHQGVGTHTYSRAYESMQATSYAPQTAKSPNGKCISVPQTGKARDKGKSPNIPNAIMRPISPVFCAMLSAAADAPWLAAGQRRFSRSRRPSCSRPRTSRVNASVDHTSWRSLADCDLTIARWSRTESGAYLASSGTSAANHGTSIGPYPISDRAGVPCG